MRVPGGPNPIRRRGGHSLKSAIIRRLIKEDIHARVKEACEAAVPDALQIARDFSSGTVNSRLAGRPYSKAHQNKAFDPGYINIGIGKKRHPGAKFVDGWEPLPSSKGPGIRNSSPIAPYLEQPKGGAKSRMVQRDIARLIISAMDPIVRRHLDTAFRDGTLTSSSSLRAA